MKKIIHTITIVIGLFVPALVDAQPLLYKYSQFSLSVIFKEFENDIVQSYEGTLINAFGPKRNPLAVLPFNAQRTERAKEESVFLLRKKLDSIVGRNKYVLFCPEYWVSKKVIISCFNDGFEAIWQHPEGDYTYMIHRNASDDIIGRSFIALFYDKKLNEARIATTEEWNELYDLLLSSVQVYTTTPAQTVLPMQTR